MMELEENIVEMRGDSGKPRGEFWNNFGKHLRKR